MKLAELALTGLAIDFEDRTTPTPAKNGIGRLDVSVKNISLAEAAAPIALKLSVATLPSGTIDVEGTAGREPLSADLAVKVASVPLAGATPYAEPMLNIVFTTEGFDGNLSAFVDKERAKTRIVKEHTSGFGVIIEETWPIGSGERGVAIALLAVQNGVGIRLACLGGDATFDSHAFSAA